MSYFVAYRFSIPCPHHRARVSAELQQEGRGRWLVLDTCQRLELYSADGLPSPSVLEYAVDRVDGHEAFLRLANIAAGLDSRVLGELEILGQVRQSYKALVESAGEARTLCVFQDVLALARKARKASGIDQRLTSLSGLASRYLLDQVEPGTPIAVLGSGSIASACVRYLSKRGESPVRIASRCPEKAMQLAVNYGGFSRGLDGLEELLVGVGGVLCATAAPHPLLYPAHLELLTPAAVVVDLGVPADCSEACRISKAIRYTSLVDVEQLAESNRADRQARAAIAEAVIAEGVAHWAGR